MIVLLLSSDAVGALTPTVSKEEIFYQIKTYFLTVIYYSTMLKIIKMI